jgi:hypothetical protein
MTNRGPRHLERVERLPAYRNLSFCHLSFVMRASLRRVRENRLQNRRQCCQVSAAISFEGLSSSEDAAESVDMLLQA